MAKTKSLLDAGTAEWQDRIATLSAEVAELERQHRAALVAVDTAAAMAASGHSAGSKQLAEARETAANIAEEIATRRTILAAAARERQAAEARETEARSVAHAEHVEKLARQVTEAAERLERAASELDTAASAYKSLASEYGLATGAGRDHAHPHHRHKILVSLQSWLIQHLESVQIPGTRDTASRKSQLIKPAAAGFLE